MDRHIMAKDRAGQKCYLGDGVYVVHDGLVVWLTAEDGMVATEAIYMEPSVVKKLNEFIQSLARDGGVG